MKILIVEDHADLAANIGDFLSDAGHTLEFATDGRSGLAKAETGSHDVIVLDRLMPGMDGVTVCQRLRQRGVVTPVLMLTALDNVDDRVTGLQAGADDYLGKPFSMAELLARLEALHRRASGGTTSRLEVGDLLLDLDTRIAKRAGQTLTLNLSSFQLLSALMRDSPKVVTRETLERAVWGDEPPDNDVLRTHMYLLRQAVDKPFEKTLIHTVHGVGYRLAEAED